MPVSKEHEVGEPWVEDLPERLSMDKESRMGDIVVFEWRVENGKRVPGAFIRALEQRQGKRKVSKFTIHGEEILSPDERQQFLRSDPPRLTFTRPFPTPVTVWLHSDVQVEIPALKRRQVHGQQEVYEWLPTEVHFRDLRGGVMVRRVPPNPRYKRGNDDAETGPSAVSVARARVESAYTRNPKHAVDQAEYMPCEVRLDQQEKDDMTRSRKSKIEQLMDEREGHLRRLQTTKSEISKRILPARVENLNRQIAELNAAELKSAA